MNQLKYDEWWLWGPREPEFFNEEEGDESSAYNQTSEEGEE